MVIEQKTVNFGEYNSKTDLGLAFISFTKSAPTPQIKTIDIPFRDGALDITEYFGEIRYNNRDLNFTFYIPWETDDHATVYTNVLDKLHGKKMKIQLASDPDWYYIGRLEVGEESIQNGFWAFQIVASCYPYKLSDVERSLKVDNLSVNPKNITLLGTRMPVIPEVEVEPVSFKIIYKDEEYNYGTGTFPDEDHPVFSLDEGDNYMLISGKGSLTFNTPVNIQTENIDCFEESPKSVNVKYEPKTTINPNLEVHLDESTLTVTPKLTVNLDASTVTVTPTITVENSDDGITIIFNGVSYIFNQGSSTAPGFVFSQGTNTFEASGRGILTIDYSWHSDTYEINTEEDETVIIRCDYVRGIRIDYKDTSNVYPTGEYEGSSVGFALDEGENSLFIYGVGSLKLEYTDVSETFQVNQPKMQPLNIVATYIRPGIDIIFNEETYTYYSGLFLANFELSDGINSLSLIGDGTIKFTYDDVEEEFEVTSEESPLDIELTYQHPTSVTPIIISAPDMTLALRDNEYSFSEGKHTNVEFSLKEGANNISIVGQGKIKFIYKEGRL